MLKFNRFIEAEILCRSSIQIISYFLDEYRESSAMSSKFISSSITWINYDILVALKKLRTLQADYKIFLSPEALASRASCMKVIGRLAEARAIYMISQSEQEVLKLIIS